MRAILLPLLLPLLLSTPAFADGFASANGFAFCSAADVGSTIAAVQNGAIETNPLWKHSVNQHHYTGLVLGNLALVGFAYKFEADIPKNAFLFINVFRCGIAGANLRFVF
jgi:hypothetical protein